MIGARAVRDLQERSRMERGRPVRFARQARIGAGAVDGGFNGDDDCNCGDCPQGIPLPGTPTQCCDGHPVLVLVDPSDGVTRYLYYAPNDKWATEEFNGQTCEIEAADQTECENAGGTWNDPVCNHANVYAIVLTVDVDGDTFLEKILVTNNGCPVECWRYKAEGFNCQCQNYFRRMPGWSVADGRSPPACDLCVRPHTEIDGVSDAWQDAMTCAQLPEEVLKPAEMLVIAHGFGGYAMTAGGGGSDCSISVTWMLTDSWMANVDVDVNGNVLQTAGATGSTPCANGDCVWRGNRDAGTWTDSFGTIHTLKVAYQTCLHRVDANTVRYTVRMCAPRFPGCSTPCAQSGFQLAPCSFVTYTKDIDITGLDDAQTQAALFESLHTLDRSGGWTDADGATFNSTCTNTTGHPQTGVVPDTIVLVPGPAAAAGTQRETATTDGSCDGCTTTGTAPTDPGAGKCCISNKCNPYFTETNCDDAGGEWFADDAECDSTCGQPGVCCQTTNTQSTCLEMTKAECTALGAADLGAGYTFHAGETCATFECPPKGACCEVDGGGASCDFGLFENECSGAWYEGLLCDDIQCGEGPDVKACCRCDPDLCGLVEEEVCNRINQLGGGWTWHPENSDCMGNPCECEAPPTGSCCHPDGSGNCFSPSGDCICTDGLTEEECIALHSAVTGCMTSPNVVWHEGETCASVNCGCDGGGTDCCESQIM